jgi:hypothetical protein
VEGAVDSEDEAGDSVLLGLGDVVAVELGDPARGLSGAFHVETAGAEDLCWIHPSVASRHDAGGRG